MSKQGRHWAIEKPKLDNVRKLRGIYYVDVEDMEFKDTEKNARKKLEVQLESAMPCKKEQGREKLGRSRARRNPKHRQHWKRENNFVHALLKPMTQQGSTSKRL